MFDGGELQAMSDEGLIDALQRAHGAAAFAQAAEVLAVRELYRRRAADTEDHASGRAGEFAATEAAVAVQISEAVAVALIDLGLGLDRLPRTRAAFTSGRIDLARAQVIAENIRDLPAELLDGVEQTLIEAAARSNPVRLRQMARRWVAKLDPEGEQRRREQREQGRDVRIKAVQDGMAIFEGLLPAVGAQTVAMRLREMSLQVCEADPRSMPQRRADALVALADGSQRLRCACGRGSRCPAPDVETPRRPLIQIGIAAGALLDERGTPAHLAGYGPLDADRVCWTSPTGDEHTTVREGTRYLFPHSDIESPDVLWPSPTTVPAPPYPSTVDLSYPIDRGVFVHPELATMTPEDDLPGHCIIENPSR